MYSADISRQRHHNKCDRLRPSEKVSDAVTRFGRAAGHSDPRTACEYHVSNSASFQFRLGHSQVRTSRKSK
jgi:hypothetical protein